MKIRSTIFAFLRLRTPACMFLLLMITVPAYTADDLSGETVIARYIETQSPESEVSFLRMKVIKPGIPAKEYRILYAYQNQDSRSRYLLRMIRPLDVKNVTVLANEKEDNSVDQYLYLPTIGKSRKLKKGSLNKPFLDSDFTYEDLLREIPSQQKYERLDDMEILGKPCYSVAAYDLAEANKRAYHHRVLYLEKSSFNLIKVDFFSSIEKKSKTLTAYRYQSTEIKGETTRPQRVVMINEESRTSTIFEVIEGRLNKPLDKEIFTPQNIENWSDEAIEEFIFQMELTYD